VTVTTQRQAAFEGTYFGAHASFPDRIQTAWLIVNADGVFVYTHEQPSHKKRAATPAEKRVHIPWNEVVDLEVDGTSVSSTSGPKMGAVLAFGVAGLATGHKTTTKHATTVIVKTGQGNVSFQILAQNLSASAVSAQIALYTPATFGEVATPEPAASSTTEALTLLAQLHDSGLLTDDEFAAKRAEVIARI